MIRVEALGGLRIMVNGEESVPLAKQRLKSALLVYLAVERSCLREALIGTFWPEREPERARHVLSQTVYELRKMLGEEWLTIAGDRLTASERVSSDVVEFTEAVERGALETALRLYHGAFLDGTYLAETHEFEDWSDRRNQKVTKLLRRALRETCELPDVPAWIDVAIDVARKSAERDPTDDEIQHALIQLLVRAGRRTDALRQYEKYEAALADDDLEPLDNTRALIATIRDATESVDPVVVTPFTQPPVPVAVPPVPRPAAQPRASGRTSAEKAAARRRSSAIAGGAVVIALAVVLPILIARGSQRESTKASTPATPRIAVLPLRDNSSEKNLGYLTSAITEGLAGALSNVRGLEVRSDRAVRYYDEETMPQDSLARVLNVDWFVVGSLARSGDRLVALVQLVDASTGKLRASTDTTHVWTDFLEMRDTLVADLSILLRRALGPAVEVQNLQAQAGNAKAWDDYLRAKQIHDDFVAYMLTNGVDAAENALRTADSLAQASTHDDPRWAAPVILRGRLAAQRVQAILSRPGPNNRPAIRSALERGLDFADKAISLDRSSADGYELRGLLRYRVRVMPGLVNDTVEMRKMEAGIESDLLKAVTMDSARAESWSTLSELYYRHARFAEAQQTALRAYEADSYYSGALSTLYRLALSSFEMGNDQLAHKYCDEGRRRFPRYHQFVYCGLMLLAWSDTSQPDIDSAWRLTRVADLVATPSSQNNDAMFQLMTASVIARSGKPDSAAHVIEALAPAVRADLSLLWIEAAARARLGDFARADSLLSAFVQGNGLQNSEIILKSRALKPLRDELLKAGTAATRR